MFVLGGAGPDPGKGFETVHGQLWILNLSTKCWLRAKCKGSLPEQFARFEHTATLVGDAAEGNGELLVVGGLSQSSILLPKDNDARGLPSYEWGGPQASVLSLNVETLVRNPNLNCS